MNLDTRVRLILTDLDGTVMPLKTFRVLDSAKAALRRAISEGILAGPATGRAYSWALPFFGGETDLCQTAIAVNGMEVYVGGEPVLQKTVSGEALEHISRVIADIKGAASLCFVGDSIYRLSGSYEDLCSGIPEYAKKSSPWPAQSSFPEEATKAVVAVNASREKTVEVAELLNREVGELTFDVSMKSVINVMPRGWHKGEALKWLGAYLGIPRDEIMVFGDAENDIHLFENAGISVAVQDGSEAAKAAARYVCAPCAADGVAQTINALLDGEDLDALLTR